MDIAEKMQIPNAVRVQILVNALPYIQKYNGKIVVVKYGGNAMTSQTLKDAVMTDVVLLSLVGIRVVLVHGGGPEIDEMLHRIGKKSSFVGGLRYTDKETAEIVQMVLAGKVNKGLVSLLSQHGGTALGLCGIDGNMLSCERKTSIDAGYVGHINCVNTKPILDALAGGYIPVISTVATDAAGDVYNINADTAAAKIAAALKAESLILMTDVCGLLRDKEDERTLITHLDVSEVSELTRSGIITSGMIPKVECCVEAIRRGVKKSVIIDGRIPHSIMLELFSDEGIGTLFTRVK